MRGPTIRFLAGSTPPVLVLGDRSVTAAVAVLASLDIGHEVGDGLHVTPSDALGLHLRLVDT